jgi:hypothetical protein
MSVLLLDQLVQFAFSPALFLRTSVLCGFNTEFFSMRKQAFSGQILPASSNLVSEVRATPGAKLKVSYGLFILGKYVDNPVLSLSHP